MPKYIELLPCDWLISNLCYQATEQVFLIKWPVSYILLHILYIYVYCSTYILLQVCALGWVKCREHISLLVILCIIVYVTNKSHLSLNFILLLLLLSESCSYNKLDVCFVFCFFGGGGWFINILYTYAMFIRNKITFSSKRFSWTWLSYFKPIPVTHEINLWFFLWPIH